MRHFILFFTGSDEKGGITGNGGVTTVANEFFNIPEAERNICKRNNLESCKITSFVEVTETELNQAYP